MKHFLDVCSSSADGCQRCDLFGIKSYGVRIKIDVILPADEMST